MNDASCSEGSEGRFLLLVGGLLVVILALLAGLWVSMRRRALRAERELARLQQRQRRLEAILLGLTSQPPPRPVRRERLSARAVKVNGRSVRALELPALAARKLGFRPGDVILVAPDRPASARTSAPASRSARAGPPQR